MTTFIIVYLLIAVCCTAHLDLYVKFPSVCPRYWFWPLFWAMPVFYVAYMWGKFIDYMNHQ